MASTKSNVSKKEKMFVVAIDFGTTFSGWAYSSINDDRSKPMQIYARQWNNGKYISMKEPTTLLIQPDGKTLEAFGSEAEERYAELIDEGEHETYYYFERFKMMLFDNKNLTRNEELKDVKGKRLPAKRVFALAIKYLKDDFFEESRDKIDGELKEGDIEWVLTVPAIWNPSAKQFMRECAVEAGIRSSNLLIALEPEAASLYCKSLEIHKQNNVNSTTSLLSSFKPGEKYMVVDAGGGTIDIIVHEVCTDGTLKEIYKANGGHWGGILVDKAFFDILIRIFGGDVMEKFQDEERADFLELQRNFELKKRNINSDKVKLNLKIPVSLSDMYEEVNSEKVTNRIEKDKGLNGKVQVKKDKISLDRDLNKSLFSFINDNLVPYLENILKEEALADVNKILMVGGFSECKILLAIIKSSFPSKKVMLIEDAGLAVLKGAVLYGHDNKNISIRISRYTYGFELNDKYNPLIHPYDREIIIDTNGQPLVRGCFKKLIKMGEELTPGNISRRHEVEPLKNNSKFSLNIYASTLLNPIFVDEPDCFKIGQLFVD